MSAFSSILGKLSGQYYYDKHQGEARQAKMLEMVINDGMSNINSRYAPDEILWASSEYGKLLHNKEAEKSFIEHMHQAVGAANAARAAYRKTQGAPNPSGGINQEGAAPAALPAPDAAMGANGPVSQAPSAMASFSQLPQRSTQNPTSAAAPPVPAAELSATVLDNQKNVSRGGSGFNNPTAPAGSYRGANLPTVFNDPREVAQNQVEINRPAEDAKTEQAIRLYEGQVKAGSRTAAAATPWELKFNSNTGKTYRHNQVTGEVREVPNLEKASISPPPQGEAAQRFYYQSVLDHPEGHTKGELDQAEAGLSKLNKQSGDNAPFEENAYQDWIKRPENKGKGRDQFRVFQNKAMDNLPAPKSEMVYIPDGKNGYKAVDIRPGQTIPAGAITRTGMNSVNVPTSVTRTMYESAPAVKSLAQQTATSIDRAEKKLGPLAGRWSDIWVGKVGATDPDIKKLRVDVALLTTRLMRMHVGGRGGEMMLKHFSELLDTAKDSPENMRAALTEIMQYADTTLAEAKASGMGVGDTLTPPQTNSDGWSVRVKPK